jgi:hypothetical protein
MQVIKKLRSMPNKGTIEVLTIKNIIIVVFDYFKFTLFRRMLLHQVCA